MRACNCGNKAVLIRNAALAQAQADRMYLVTCLSCTKQLKTSEGGYLPAHVLPVQVSEATVALWKEQGYELEITRL